MNQNGKFFDLGYIQGKNIENPRFAFIQVKKGNISDESKVDFIQAKIIYEQIRKKFNDLFGFTPGECNLIYISLLTKNLKN